MRTGGTKAKMSTILAELSTELEPPPEPQRKKSRGGKRAAKASSGACPAIEKPQKRQGGRPYKKLPAEILEVRIGKLTERLEKAKKQVRGTPVLHSAFHA